MDKYLPNKKYLRWDEVLQCMADAGMKIARSTLYGWAEIGTIANKKVNGKIWFEKDSVEMIIKSDIK